MAKDRFELRSAARGFWSVFDGTTNQPVSYRNCLMIRLGLDEADAFAGLLNENWRLMPGTLPESRETPPERRL